MATKTRSDLKSAFQAGTILSKMTFDDLVDSMLNKRSDQFFGIWQPGKRYWEGDVVIYQKSLYLLQTPMEDCEEVEEKQQNDVKKGDMASAAEASRSMDKTTKDPNTSKKSICSECAPDIDDNWCQLQLEVKDEDWECTLDADTGELLYVFNVKAKVGIGTETPATSLAIKGDSGMIQADPDAGKGPRLGLATNEELGGCRVDWQLGDESRMETDSIGYAFFRSRKEEGNYGSLKQGKGAKVDDLGEPQLLFFLTNKDGRPLAGVGTDQPKGVLQAEDESHSRLVVGHHGSDDASILLVNTQPMGTCHYLLSGVGQEVAYLQTDAHDGLRIIMGGDLASLPAGMGQGKVAISVLQNGYVGVGTESPRSLVEVSQPNIGAVRTDFSHDNVCVSISNERSIEDKNANYLSLGVDQDFGIFSTDADCGFTFKAGRQHGDYDGEVDITQGNKVAYLSNEGRMGLRTESFPAEIDLEVNGHQRSLTAYLATDPSIINAKGSLDPEDTLARVLCLNPCYFEWADDSNGHRDKRQIGFSSKNVQSQFPELVHKANKLDGVAYGNMTAVLVAAIQQQNKLIGELRDRIEDLEGQANNDNKKMS